MPTIDSLTSAYAGGRDAYPTPSASVRPEAAPSKVAPPATAVPSRVTPVAARSVGSASVTVPLTLTISAVLRRSHGRPSIAFSCQTGRRLWRCGPRQPQTLTQITPISSPSHTLIAQCLRPHLFPCSGGVGLASVVQFVRRHRGRKEPDRRQTGQASAFSV